MFERSPGSFNRMGEEQLRDQFLGPLNTQYAGQVTAETFNRRGKTDLLVRQGHHTLLVGECKIWRGPKTLIDGIKQLLSYMTWRESTGALLVFNRSRRFATVLQKTERALNALPSIESVADRDHRGEYTCVVRHPAYGDPGARLVVMLFDLSTK